MVNIGEDWFKLIMIGNIEEPFFKIGLQLVKLGKNGSELNLVE